MSEPVTTPIAISRQRIFIFVDRVEPGQPVLMVFTDPSPCYVVEITHSASPLAERSSGPRAATLHVTLQPEAPASSDRDIVLTHASNNAPVHHVPAPIVLRSRGIELTWQPGRAFLHCAPQDVESLLHAILDFTHYESELQKIEQEIAATWQELEQDRSLAFQVTSADLKRGPLVGARMSHVLQRRIRHARIEPHLFLPEPASSAGTRLGKKLRRAANIQTRLETAGDQLEVFEDVYEMASQRLGEFRASSQEHTLEWVIIVLLAAEALLMLVQTLWHHS